MGRFLIHIDAQDAQDFFRRRLACVPGHPQIRTRSSPESASRAAASRPDYPVHPVHRCSIHSPSRWICPVAGGGGPACRQTGVSQRVHGGFLRSRPPDTLHLTIGTTPPGSAGVPPACCPFGCRSVSLRCCSRPPCRREPHGPGRSRGRAPLPVDSGGGDGRSCGRICAGGTPALPGGLPPMTWSHQRDKSAEAFWRQLSLKEVHQSRAYSCSLVVRLIRVPHSWFKTWVRVFIETTIGRFSSNDLHGRMGGRLTRIGAPTMKRVRPAGWAWLIRGASGR